jgi:hypothetical protein
MPSTSGIATSISTSSGGSEARARQPRPRPSPQRHDEAALEQQRVADRTTRKRIGVGDDHAQPRNRLACGLASVG